MLLREATTLPRSSHSFLSHKKTRGITGFNGNSYVCSRPNSSIDKPSVQRHGRRIIGIAESMDRIALRITRNRQFYGMNEPVGVMGERNLLPVCALCIILKWRSYPGESKIPVKTKLLSLYPFQIL